MAGAKSWVIGTCRGGSRHVLGRVQNGPQCVGDALTVMFSTRFMSVYLNILTSVFMSATSQILTVKMSEGTK